MAVIAKWYLQSALGLQLRSGKYPRPFVTLTLSLSPYLAASCPTCGSAVIDPAKLECQLLSTEFPVRLMLVDLGSASGSESAHLYLVVHPGDGI